VLGIRLPIQQLGAAGQDQIFRVAQRVFLYENMEAGEKWWQLKNQNCTRELVFKTINFFPNKQTNKQINTEKSRYNALQGTMPGERYMRESTISGNSLFAVFSLFFLTKKGEKTGEKAVIKAKFDQSVKKS